MCLKNSIQLFNATSRPLYPPGKGSGANCTRGWVCPWADPDGCGEEKAFWPTLIFGPRTVQPEGSRCTHYAIPAPLTAAVHM